MADSKGSARAAERSKARPARARDGDPSSTLAEDDETPSRLDKTDLPSAKARKTASRASRNAAKDETEARPKTAKPPRSARTSERRGNPIARLIRFIREVVAELRKVIWPTRKELITYTSVVIVFVTIMVTIVWLLDFGFAKAVLWVFGGGSESSTTTG